MSKKQKLIKRLKSRPKDFTFDEMEALLFALGFKKVSVGKTSGSRVKYEFDDIEFRAHKPHPGNQLKHYQVNQIINTLEQEGLI